MPGLGRRYSPDENDKRYMMRKALMPFTETVAEKYWDDWYWWGNQIESSECVGYSWAHWLEDAPVIHDHSVTPPPVVAPDYLYNEAKLVDEWEGEDYEGTSVRAGAKVLQALGYIEQYVWTWDVEDIAHAILTVGPVVVGTEWFDDMFSPDELGVIRPGGPVVGGHAYLINGYSKTTQLFRIKNSWGKEWGANGYAYISYNDLDFLLHREGEACLALELAILVPDVDPEPLPDPVPVPVPETPDAEEDIGDIIRFFQRIWRKIIGWLGF